MTAGAWPSTIGVFSRRLLAGGVGGLALASLGLLSAPTQFFQSYLMAYVFCLHVALGCLALGMVHQLSGGEWGRIIRRPLTAATRLMPFLTVLFLPILAGMTRLYPWTDAAAVAGDALLQAKRAYLNIPFFVIRAAIYFAAWNGLAYVLDVWAVAEERALRHDDVASARHFARQRQRASAIGLVVYGLTVTFASFDWLMSLEPRWYSTIYGMLAMAGQGLSALAFLGIVVVATSRRPPLDRIVEPVHLHDLGNLTLAFVMLWAYVAFSQYLIIWSGNLPLEIAWYTHRLQTGWRVIGTALIVFHFALPFLLLLSRTVKREGRWLSAVAAGILVARLVDLFWLIAPEFHTTGVAVSWLDVVLPASLGALCLGVFLRRLAERPIMPPEPWDGDGVVVREAIA